MSNARAARSSRRNRAHVAPNQHRTTRNDNVAPAANGGGPRDPRAALPVAAVLEVVRWGFYIARATVADFPEEAEALDRVEAAAERVITGHDPDALTRLDEVDILTAASILITAIDSPDGEQLAELAGLGLDRMTHGARCERTPTATPLVPVSRTRAPLLVRHLRLVP